MDGYSFNEYDDDSKSVLIKVVKELKEQWLANKCQPQFWFYATRVSNKELTEQIIIKWLMVLANKGVIHFYKPTIDTVLLQSFMIEKSPEWTIDSTHNWDWRGYLSYSLMVDAPTDHNPGIAVDILESDFDLLIQILSQKRTWGKFSIDRHGRYSYDRVLLTSINNSEARRIVLGELLSAKDHILSAQEIDRIISDDGTGEKRRKVTSELNIELKKISREIDIKTVMRGQKANHYELVVK